MFILRRRIEFLSIESSSKVLFTRGLNCATTTCGKRWARTRIGNAMVFRFQIFL
jgi:hypothetical protein